MTAMLTIDAASRIYADIGLDAITRAGEDTHGKRANVALVRFIDAARSDAAASQHMMTFHTARLKVARHQRRPPHMPAASTINDDATRDELGKHIPMKSFQHTGSPYCRHAEISMPLAFIAHVIYSSDALTGRVVS